MKPVLLFLFCLFFLLLAGCGNPYKTSNGLVLEKLIEQDIKNVETYTENICNTADLHNEKIISMEECLDRVIIEQHFQHRDSPGSIPRLIYILQNAKEFDGTHSDRAIDATAKLFKCETYIQKNCE